MKLPSGNYGRLTIVSRHIYILKMLMIPIMAILLIWYSIALITTEPPETLRILLGMANSVILASSLGMSLFLTDAFNTGKFITQTLVSGIVFVLAIVVYNTVEHYILHWLAHTLHISNVMIASLLSGVIVLVISPVHHRLTHFLNKRLRKKEEHA